MGTGAAWVDTDAPLGLLIPFGGWLGRARMPTGGGLPLSLSFSLICFFSLRPDPSEGTTFISFMLTAPLCTFVGERPGSGFAELTDGPT